MGSYAGGNFTVYGDCEPTGQRQNLPTMLFVLHNHTTFLKMILLMEEVRLTTWDIKKDLVNNRDKLPINWLAGFLNQEQ